ncbi:transposase [Edwardsiella ictaluri]|uniref:transposase n=1 Tax=Edwardsiella ictaluri TaxID=67780 RepID=UPI0029B72FB7|nr:transposase [Edwardsiella ictaluri]
MAKQTFKITNEPAYDKALRQRGSLAVWPDKSAMAAWADSAQPASRDRPRHDTDMAITTLLMVKCVFHLSFQGLVDSILQHPPLVTSHIGSSMLPVDSMGLTDAGCGAGFWGRVTDSTALSAPMLWFCEL